MASDWLYPVVGLLVGLLVGLTGMGGGVLMTPLLVLLFGMAPSLAVGTDLAYAFVTKIAGALQHWRQGSVDLRLVRDMALGSVPASVVAVWMLNWLRETYQTQAEYWLGRLIGGVLFLVALLMAQRVLLGTAYRLPAELPAGRPRIRLVLIGALGGLLVGMTSVGSGTVIMALLVLVAPLSAEKLVGTDLAHAVLLLGVAAAGHLFLGDVDLRVVGLLILGSLPGVIAGSRLTMVLPRRVLQGLLIILLMISSVKLLSN